MKYLPTLFFWIILVTCFLSIGHVIDKNIGYLIIILGFYFWPSFIAWGKERKNSSAIFTLNLLLGWTFVGWVVSLVWALVNDKA